jgi:ribosome-associated toxin RatA of RatAB toxin-antitoxin module
LRYTTPDKRQYEATLTVGLPPLFQETYTSAVQACPNTYTVVTKSLTGKNFDALSSRWQLSEVHNGVNNSIQCQVVFEVEITASDPLIAGTLDRVLEQVAGKQVEAFAQRCAQVPW